MSVTMAFDGFFNSIRDELRRRESACLRAVEVFVAVRLVGDAQELCPIDTGALAASATWDPAYIGKDQAGNDSIICVCGFNLDYAMARHETYPEGDAPPKQSPNPEAGWKFLERAMRVDAAMFTQFVRGQVEGSGAE